MNEGVVLYDAANPSLQKLMRVELSATAGVLLKIQISSDWLPIWPIISAPVLVPAVVIHGISDKAHLIRSVGRLETTTTSLQREGWLVAALRSVLPIGVSRWIFGRSAAFYLGCVYSWVVSLDGLKKIFCRGAK